MASQVTFHEAVERLKRFGINGPELYLIDVIPLIEMIWADGKNQAKEVELLDDFLVRHVERVNKKAQTQVLSADHARAFSRRYLEIRPDPRLLAELRSLVAPIRLANEGDPDSAAFRFSMLATCLDIASAAVTEYPFGMTDRFNLEEKVCFFQILEALKS
jgi:hypothetical protein